MSEHWREEEFIPYLDGRLTGAERTRLETHLAACATCHAHLEDLRAVTDVLGEWTAPEPSAGFDAALRARLAEEVPPRLAGIQLRPAYAAALAVALLVVVGVGLWRWAPPAPPAVPQVAQTPPAVATPPQVIPTVPTEPAPGDDLAVLDNPVLLENYELLEEFDVLFEPLTKEEKKL